MKQLSEECVGPRRFDATVFETNHARKLKEFSDSVYDVR
jgi:hypothetical protein